MISFPWAELGLMRLLLGIMLLIYLFLDTVKVGMKNHGDSIEPCFPRVKCYSYDFSRFWKLLATWNDYTLIVDSNYWTWCCDCYAVFYLQNSYVDLFLLAHTSNIFIVCCCWCIIMRCYSWSDSKCTDDCSGGWRNFPH